MNKKIFSILVSIFAVCGMIMTTGSASAATVNSVEITSPTTTNKAYVKPGGNVIVNFTVITDSTAFAGMVMVEIKKGDGTPIISSPWVSTTFEAGTSIYPFLETRTIPAGTADGAYNVIVTADTDPQSRGEYDIETGAVVVDNTAPTSTVTIAKSAYNESAWDDASTINGTVSDGAGSGVKTITITIKDNNNNQYWDGDSWEATTTNLSATLGVDTWTYNFDNSHLTDGHSYTVTPTATDNLDNSAQGNSDNFIYDITPPAAFSVLSATTTGGNIVTGKWNNTNTGVDITVNIADDPSLLGGTIQIQAQVDSGAFQNLGAPVTITGINTRQTVSITAAQLETLTGFGNNKNITFTAIITDVAGNSTTASPSFPSLYVDETPPDAPVAANITVNQKAPGTNDTIAGSNGAVEGYAIVEVWNNATAREVSNLIASTPADGYGAFAEIGIGDNAYGTVWVTAKDSSGNRSDAISKTNDITPPAAPSITLLDPINPTNEIAVTITGTGEANATIAWSVDDDANPSTTAITGTSIVDTEGNINITGINVSTLDDGTLTASVVLTDAAGNTGPAGTDTVTKDTVNPTVVSVTPTLLNEASAAAPGTVTVIITFSEPMDGTTDPTVTVQGLHSSPYAVTTTEIQWSDGNTKWTGSFTFADDNEEVNTAYYAISGVEDANGNEMANLAERTDANKLDVDTVAPNAPSITSIGGADNKINNSEKAAIHVVGTAEANSLVSVTLSDGTNSITGTQQLAGGATDFDITIDGTTALPNALVDGTITLSATATDAAGNESSATTTPTTTQDTVAPTVSNVTSITADGFYKANDVITVTVTFNEAVNVTGTPQLELETGINNQKANYASGSGSGTLTFTYTVQFDDTSADLDYTGTGALTLNDGTIKDAAGNDATLTLPTPGAGGSLAANKDLVIDTKAPDTATVTTPINGARYKAGAVPTTFTGSIGDDYTGAGINANSATIVILNTSHWGYWTGSEWGTVTHLTTTHEATTDGTNVTWSYDASAVTYQDGDSYAVTVTATDKAGNTLVGSSAIFTYDATAPTVSNVTSAKDDGSYKANDTITVTVTFTEAVNVTGTPQLELETGATDQKADYTSGSSSTTLTFTYIVQSGDTSNDLDYTGTGALILNGGTIKDVAGNDATLTLAAPGTTGSLSYNKALIIDTTPPLAPVEGNLMVTQNAPGTDDTISGSNGAVEGDATVEVWNDETLREASNLISSTTAATNGSFVAISIGDNAWGTVWVTAKDTAGNRSNAISKNNDIVAPTVTINIPDSINATNKSSAPVIITSNENGTYVYTISDGTNGVTNTNSIVAGTPINLNLDLSGLKDGAITADAYVTDAAGNRGDAPQDTATKNTAVQDTTTSMSGQFSQTAPTTGKELSATTEAMTIDELIAKVNELKAQLEELQKGLLQSTSKLLGATYEGIPQNFTFKTNLKKGDSSIDVKYLQIMLNSDPDTRLATSGVGSLGNETTYFGPLTKAAIIKFQEKYKAEILTPQGLTSGTGLVANATRTKLNQLLGK